MWKKIHSLTYSLSLSQKVLSFSVSGCVFLYVGEKKMLRKQRIIQDFRRNISYTLFTSPDPSPSLSSLNYHLLYMPFAPYLFSLSFLLFIFSMKNKICTKPMCTLKSKSYYSSFLLLVSSRYWYLLFFICIVSIR